MCPRAEKTIGVIFEVSYINIPKTDTKYQYHTINPSTITHFVASITAMIYIQRINTQQCKNMPFKI